MNKILITIPLLASSLLAMGQNLSKAMTTYIEGCGKLLSAIENDRISDAADAKIAFSKIEIAPFVDFTPVGTSSSDAIGNPFLEFTPEYTVELVKSGKISKPKSVAPHQMRTDEVDILVWNASINPHSEASFNAFAADHCEMLIYSTTDSELTLKVVYDGKSTTPKRLDGKPASVAVWDMEPGEFTFTITNNGGQPSTFVIAIN